MEFLLDYGLFFAKLFTVIIGLLLLVGGLSALMMRDKHKTGDGHIEIKHLNEKIHGMQQSIKSVVLDRFSLKQQHKADKAKAKADAKAEKKARKSTPQDNDSETPGARKQVLYVLDFHGDMRASAVASLREEITAILSVIQPGDEVAVRLESPGGVVHGYGLAASQLLRIKERGVKLTICVDKVAASGGYMMACIADRILAAPFAVLGSIGVMAQLPNFHRLLKKNNIDFELLTAGEFKRTLTVLGENTDKGRAKFQQDLEDTHGLFKEFVQQQRASVDINQVSTGEIWFGKRALDVKLVDELKTSDQFLIERCESSEVYEVKYIEKKPIQEKLGLSVHALLDGLLLKWADRFSRSRFL